MDEIKTNSPEFMFGEILGALKGLREGQKETNTHLKEMNGNIAQHSVMINLLESSIKDNVSVLVTRIKETENCVANHKWAIRGLWVLVLFIIIGVVTVVLKHLGLA